MNKENKIALIRQRRDLSLEVVSWIAWSVYFLVSFTYLAVNDVKGNDILGKALVVYASYAATALLYVLESTKTKVGYAMKTIRSYIALVITLLVAFPARTLCYGFVGYCNYAKRECKRIIHLEMTRREERP